MFFFFFLQLLFSFLRLRLGFLWLQLGLGQFYFVILSFFFVGYNDLALSSHRGKRSSIFILVIHETRMFYTFHLSGVFF